MFCTRGGQAEQQPSRTGYPPACLKEESKVLGSQGRQACLCVLWYLERKLRKTSGVYKLVDEEHSRRRGGVGGTPRPGECNKGSRPIDGPGF